MSLFDRIGAAGAPQQPMNMQDALNQLKQDPQAFLRRAGVNVPDGMAGNPQAIVQHLIQSGQVGGGALQRIMPMIRQLTGK